MTMKSSDLPSVPKLFAFSCFFHFKILFSASAKHIGAHEYKDFFFLYFVRWEYVSADNVPQGITSAHGPSAQHCV